MFEFSPGKLFLLALIALLVLGPDKLPGAARTIGALLRRVRAYWENARSQIERELDLEEVRRAAQEAEDQAKAAQNQAHNALQQLREEMDHAREEVEEDIDTSGDESGAGTTPGRAEISTEKDHDGPS